jgi:hypothetical protein
VRILTLDFEGSTNNGIREIGAVLSSGTKIIDFFDINIKNEIECKNKLQYLLSNDIDLIISHNIQTEKNLLKKYLPFPTKINRFGKFEWGPWLDTKIVYNSLYPKLKNYELKNLKELFIKSESVLITEKYCNAQKAKQHHALFDAICAFLLFKRIYNLIDIKNFIH